MPEVDHQDRNGSRINRDTVRRETDRLAYLAAAAANAAVTSYVAMVQACAPIGRSPDR